MRKIQKTINPDSYERLSKAAKNISNSIKLASFNQLEFLIAYFVKLLQDFHPSKIKDICEELELVGQLEAIDLATIQAKPLNDNPLFVWQLLINLNDTALMDTPPTFLANILAEIGPESCDKNMFLDILQQVASKLLTSGLEVQIAFALSMMCTQGGTSHRTWDIHDFGAASLEVFSKIDISQVFIHLGQAQLLITDPTGAGLIIRALRAMSKNFYEQLQIEAVFKPWEDAEKHLKLVFNMLLLPSDILNFSQTKGPRVLLLSDYTGYPSNVLSMASSLESSTWNCMKLFEFTAGLIDTENFEYAKPIFELASRQCAELLCVALASIDPSWNSINKEILVKLTCGFLLGQLSSPLVLPRVWSLNPNILLFCMVEMYRRDPSCLSRLLDVAQDLKILPIILDAKPYSFTLELACLASRRQVLNMEKWFSEALVQKGDMFIREVVNFMHQKVTAMKFGTGSPNPNVPMETLHIIINQLANVFHLMSKELAEKFREVHNTLLTRINPNISNHQIGSTNVDSFLSLPEMSFTVDIEEEVNNFFDRIFVREIGIPETIQILRRLKDSNNARDQQVFSCFLHNLFDEYRFFGKYPDSELSLTAVLFGQLINCGILSVLPLQVALRCILEALRKPTGQKLFKFGLQSLAQFHTRLSEWPQFCSQLLHISHIQHHYPDLFAYIRSSLSGEANQNIPRDLQAQSSLVAKTIAKSTIDQSSGESHVYQQFSGANNPLIELADGQKIPVPNEGVKDRILFILNNLSSTNMESKANDLIKFLEEPHFAWLAQYLVVRRASIEPNYHRLYIDFLDILQVHPLEQHILGQTYSNIYLLLESPRIGNSSNERTLLKNLGSWLGGLTLARNVPILHRDICLKELLIEAFASNRLISILPFVCKVTEQSSRSIAFQPENPWLMAILRLLAELYNFADLKLNLKFEIEVLCKNLSVDLQSLPPSNLLKRHFNDIDYFEMDKNQLIRSLYVDSKEGVCSSLVVLGPRLPSSLKSSPLMSKVVGFAVEFAIRDLGPNAIQNAMQQALKTTKTLTGKDFIQETDYKMFRQSALRMACYITVSTASALVKEPLKVSLANNLRVFLQWAGLVLPTEQIEAIADDNIDLASVFVEKFAFASAQLYFEKFFSTETALNSVSIPSSIGKIPLDFSEIYDEFGHMPNASLYDNLPNFPLDPVSEDDLGRLANLLSQGSRSSGHLSMSPKNFSAEIISPGLPATDGSLDAYFETVCMRFVDMVAAIEKIIATLELDVDSVSKLSSSHDLRSLMKQIVLLASSSPIHRDELCLLMSQRLMQGLYRTISPLYVDVIILLLIKIFEFSSKAAKEVTTWVVHSTDERKYSVLATVALFGSGLIYVLDFDGQLGKQIESGRSEIVIPFAIALIRRCIFGDKPVAAPYDFVFTVEALSKFMNTPDEDDDNNEEEKTMTLKKEINTLLKDIAAMVKSPQPESQLLRDQITFCFTDWFRLCQYPSISEKLIASFVSQLYQRRFMADEESARPFFQICTELSIELYVRQRRAPAILAYRSIDAFARLVGQILKLHPGGKSEVSNLDPLRIITIAHSVAGMVFVQGHEQGLHYLQRPLTRLFTSLSAEILQIEEFPHEKMSVIENLSTFYMLISPQSYPSFAFGWLELIINRQFLPRLINNKNRGWSILFELLREYLDFAGPLLSDIDATEASRALYRGLVRVFLIILHDCTDFLIVFGRQLVIMVPQSAIQLRNIILAAVPSSIGTLPDPLSVTVRSEYIKENFETSIMDDISKDFSNDLKSILPNMLSGKSNSPSFYHQLIEFCCTSGPSLDIRTTSRVINYLELTELAQFTEGSDIADSIKQFSVYNLVSTIISDGDRLSCYLTLCLLVDGLIYPCNLTSLNHFLLLNLFTDSNVVIKETITRVLLERLIVHRPHPWGVMVTLIELVRNPKYRFWEFPFTRITPEIERVFDAISKSCLKNQ